MSGLMVHRGQGEAGQVVEEVRGREVEAGEDRLEEEAGCGHIDTSDHGTGETQPAMEDIYDDMNDKECQCVIT